MSAEKHTCTQCLVHTDPHCADNCPGRRIIIIAPTKQDGQDEAQRQGIKPVAIVTPRSRHAARGTTADEIVEVDGLTDDEREWLMAETVSALATSGAK